MVGPGEWRGGRKGGGEFQEEQNLTIGIGRKYIIGRRVTSEQRARFLSTG